MSIKYYQLAKDEELPEEFCVVRDAGGEPSEYTFYVPETENAKLREDLEFERSENGWAREFLNRMGQKCGTKDCPSLVAYVTKIEYDNAKLRELASGLHQCLDDEGCEGCPMQDDDGWCVRDIRLRELGVEAEQ